jgi:glycosyltransferase involved in cell wall biosynthesis/peptidoglycan/xylan/chitin deacetylase (PgdA/CDA1 family)
MTRLSVVIATYDRVDALRRCLAAFERQTAPADAFEVVVVDDGSSDATGAWLDGYRPPFALQVAHQPNQGQAVAVNRGIDLVRSPYILFTDDDILAEPELIAEHLAAQEAGGGVLAAGALRLEVEAGAGGLVNHYRRWWDAHYQRLADGSRPLDFWACYTGNLSAPTAVVREVGAIDATLRRSQDIELAYRLEQAGLPLVYLARAAAVQYYSKRFADLATDFERAGEAALPMVRRHPELIRHPPLGDFGGEGRAEVSLLRVLLALRVPPGVLAPADRLLARRPPARLYHGLQRYCFWRGVQRSLRGDRDLWRRLTRPPIVLMYHAVGAPGEAASRYVVPERRFRRQLRWLRLLRHPVISLDEYHRTVEASRLCPPRAVVLTFDDAYADTAQIAVPALRRHGLSATVFAVSGAMGDANRWTANGPLAGRALMSWEDLRGIHAAGMAIGAHTVSHPKLTTLPLDAALREIEASRDRIATEIGARVEHVAYPYGSFSQELRQAVEGAGFATASGTRPGANGPATPMAALRRHEIPGTRRLPGFAAGLWLGVPLRPPRADDVSAGA